MNSDTAPWKSDWSEHGEISRGGQGIVTELRSLTDPKGELLEPNAWAFTVSRNHFQGTAVVALIGVAEGMDINLYASGYTTPIQTEKMFEWSKVAVVEDAQKSISDRTLTVIADVLVSKLAHEIRNLILKREQK